MAGQPVATGIAHISKTGISVGMGDHVVSITTMGDAETQLCDMNGRVVKTLKMHDKAMVDISDLPPGIYALAVFSGVETYSCKVLIR